MCLVPSGHCEVRTGTGTSVGVLREPKDAELSSGGIALCSEARQLLGGPLPLQHPKAACLGPLTSPGSLLWSEAWMLWLKTVSR